MINNEDYLKLQQATKFCVLRSQYARNLSNINQFLNTKFLSDEEFEEKFFSSHFHPLPAMLICGFAGCLMLILPALMIVAALFGTDSDTVAEITVLLVLIASVSAGWLIARKITSGKMQKELKPYAELRTTSEQKVPEMYRLKQEYTEKLSALTKKMQDRSNCIIPQQYWDYATLLLSYIDNCRAHDLESAINVLETDLHNQAMLSHQRKILKEQQEIRVLSEIAAENSEVAKEAARSAQINSLVSCLIAADISKKIT